ncbi:hypothetical protein CAZ10_08755 [Pseudomonas aeruginosa]|uniref:Uncharacterized protein n=1 Tax=Pseudomonas aeruginosa TaxID=287 RepID=A0A241XR82_PSEAI|nr:hypothetical protein CAZ10_08755 [Pseudomonas aeruginosa]
MVSCSKNEQEQLSTWVSFRSAQGPLLGQFSVSANRKLSKSAKQRIHMPHGGIWPMNSSKN